MWFYWCMTFSSYCFSCYFISQSKIMTNKNMHNSISQTVGVYCILLLNYSEFLTQSYCMMKLKDCFVRTLMLFSLYAFSGWKRAPWTFLKTICCPPKEDRNSGLQHVSKWFLSFKCLLISSSLKLSMFISCSES